MQNNVVYVIDYKKFEFLKINQFIQKTQFQHFSELIGKSMLPTPAYHLK